MEDRRADLVERILDAEWMMFENVKSAEPAACQQSPQTFRKVRASIFELWTEEMLQSYLYDLTSARVEGRNLVTEKYARMDNRIQRTNFNPYIEKIVAIETGWQEELRQKYPNLFFAVCRGSDPADDGSNFSVYLRCELETYGPATLDYYYQQVSKAVADGQNLSLVMLERLVLKGGYQNLDQAEQYLAEQAKRGSTR
ncbi:MAG: DUF4125 family protein [Syntrophobacteraceae bacterium]